MNSKKPFRKGMRIILGIALLVLLAPLCLGQVTTVLDSPSGTQPTNQKITVSGKTLVSGAPHTFKVLQLTLYAPSGTSQLAFGPSEYSNGNFNKQLAPLTAGEYSVAISGADGEGSAISGGTFSYFSSKPFKFTVSDAATTSGGGGCTDLGISASETWNPYGTRTPYTIYCEGGWSCSSDFTSKNLIDFGCVGASCVGAVSQEISCSEMPGAYCQDGRYIKNGKACYYPSGKALINTAECGTSVNTAIGQNNDGDALDKECGDQCDYEAGLYTPSKEICDDGRDNDCDGREDCDDIDCSPTCNPGVNVDAVSSISIGDTHACATLSDGTAYCWGSNSYGQLGNGKTESSTSPVIVQFPNPSIKAKKIGVDYYHTCALVEDGSVYCWGYNLPNAMGSASLDSAYYSLPQKVPFSLPFKDLSVTDSGACGVASTGDVYCWGTVANKGYETPTKLTSIPGAAKAVIAKRWYGCSLLEDGRVHCWAFSFPHGLPVYEKTLSFPDAAVALGGGTYHACAVLRTGAVYCWFSTEKTYMFNGYLGSGVKSYSKDPIKVSSDKFFSSVSAGVSHTCALTSSGEVYCWGESDVSANKLLGWGTPTTSPSPTLMKGIPGKTPNQLTEKVKRIEAASYGNCVLTEKNELYCWPNNDLTTGAKAMSSLLPKSSCDCNPGDVEEGASCGTCSKNKKTCTANCIWGPTECVQSGCLEGESRCLNGKKQICSSCAFANSGTDSDQDGVDAECNDGCDNVAGIFSPSAESCADAIDNDCDGAIDGADGDCCTCAAGTDKRCATYDYQQCNSDCKTWKSIAGTDNDGDGRYAQCGDSQCDSSPKVYDSTKASSEALCTDGLDNDCDGLADCADSDCKGKTGPNQKACCQSAANGDGCSQDDCIVESCTNYECSYANRNRCDGAECTAYSYCDAAGGNCRAPDDSNEVCLYCVADTTSGAWDWANNNHQDNGKAFDGALFDSNGAACSDASAGACFDANGNAINHKSALGGSCCGDDANEYYKPDYYGAECTSSADDCVWSTGDAQASNSGNGEYWCNKHEWHECNDADIGRNVGGVICAGIKGDESNKWTIRSQVRPEYGYSCTDGLDNDGDGTSDCADSDCLAGVTGTIINEKSEPVQGAKVQLSSQGTTQETTTSANGRFSLPNACNDVSATVEHPAYSTQSKSFTVAPPNIYSLQFDPLLFNCESDCTSVAPEDNTIHKECSMRAGCAFYDSRAAGICDMRQVGQLAHYDNTRHFSCPSGSLQMLSQERIAQCSQDNAKRGSSKMKVNKAPITLFVSSC